MTYHNGPAVGSTSFQKMGVIEPCHTNIKVEGLAVITGNNADRFKFKVPTPRTVEVTYPNYHDGEAQTLTGNQPNFQLPILPPSQT